MTLAEQCVVPSPGPLPTHSRRVGALITAKRKAAER